MNKRRADHFHQGLDIGARFAGDHPVLRSEAEYQAARLAGKLEIVSVVSGTVWKIFGSVKDTTSYGLTIVVKSADPIDIGNTTSTLWFLYGHCSAIAERLREGMPVEAGQVIAFVGHTGNAGAKNPHLHFEVATEPLPTIGGPDGETTPAVQRRRIDPYDVLERLGPFSARQAFVIDGTPVDQAGKVLALKHREVEHSSSGGFFPLGANNIWHGGVHLPMPARSELVAPFDGEIVAVRLDPTLHPDRQAFGSTNFVLMRHELPSRLYEALRGGNELAEAPVDPQKEAPVEHLDALEANEEDDVCCGDADPLPARLLDDVDEDADQATEGFERSEDPPQPPPPPPQPQHPERVVYCLLMHVAAQPLTDALAEAVPWLKRVSVGPGPDGVPPDVEAAEDTHRKHAEDVEEAQAHSLRKTVGNGKGQEDDVTWVQRRLARFDFLPEGAVTGNAADAQLTPAIEAFQAAHVFGEGLKKIDGLVKANSTTLRKLRKTRRELGLDPIPPGPRTISPIFVERSSQRKDDVAKVVSGLNVRVRAGEALWHSDRASGFAKKGPESLEQVHWEIFSEHPIFIDGANGWGSIEDHDDDLTADAPQSLLDLIDKDTITSKPPFILPADGILSLPELMDFYRSPESTFLRRRQCYFRVEWGLDLEATRKALVGTFDDADTFPQRVEPYQWWTQAGDRLPPFDSERAVTHVWHYNPVEFVAAYQEALRAIAPPPKKDPTRFADLQVTIFNNQGGRLGHVKVTLRRADGSTQSATTKKPDARGRDGGVVRFFDVPAGAVHLDAHFRRQGQEWNALLIPVPIHAASKSTDPFVLNELELKANVDGDGPPRGGVRVTVRRFGSIHKPPVEVALRGPAGLLKVANTSSAVAVFDDLAFGTYELQCSDAQCPPTTAVVDRKQRVPATLHRYPPEAKVLVRVLHGGAPVEHVLVNAETSPRTKPPVARSVVTDRHGESLLAVYQGEYSVTIRDSKLSAKVVRAVEGTTKLLVITLKEAPSATETGVLLVAVDAGSSSPDHQVQLCTRAHPDFAVQVARLEDGIARFVSPPGQYVVRFRDLEEEVTIAGGATISTTLAP